jgi:hypothetical protein
LSHNLGAVHALPGLNCKRHVISLTDTPLPGV